MCSSDLFPSHDKDQFSKPSSPRLQNWGMTYSGKCLTARISESHKIGKECSLSDILEEQVDQKYFLSEKMMQKNLDYSSLKMLKDFSATTTEILSEPSSPRLMNWGMTSNGKCLTARITEFPKIGKGSSLSEILEEHPDQKYFLSEKQTIRKDLEHLKTERKHIYYRAVTRS